MTHFVKSKGDEAKSILDSKYDFNSALSASKDRPKGATRFFRSRSLRQVQKSKQGHIMRVHTYNP